MKVLIVGGTGSFGAFYAKKFSEYGFDVAITGRDSETGGKFAQKNGLTWDDGTAIGGYDIVVLSVPNEAAPQMIKRFAPKIANKTLLVDLCSVKKNVVKELLKLKKRDIELASIHPMHGPRISSLVGQPVPCVIIKGGKNLDSLKKFFLDSGANFFTCTAEEHDKTLAVVQGLTHYTQFVSAAVIKETGLNLKDTLKFGTPNYNLFLSGMARVILQNPELYSQIQLSNPHNVKIRKIFSKKAKEIEKICAKSSSSELQKYIIEEAHLFKDPEAFLIESDRAANAFNFVVSILKSRIGKKVVVENMLTHSFHNGIVKDVRSQELVLKEGHNETSISISKLRLLTKQEAFDWKQLTLEKRTLDYSFLVPENAISAMIAYTLKKVCKCYFEVIDEFKGAKIPSGQKSITLRAHFFADDDKKELDFKVKETINGLGFILR
ncbi:MAG: prephenate dehydrogenase/arogenate dehydrogenase family protein [archaeon]|jgi:prephenate dehydrogenase